MDRHPALQSDGRWKRGEPGHRTERTAPLQVYVKPSKEYQVVLRSIDLGAIEIIHTYEELAGFNKVGSPFSIPKAALVLAGFHPDFSTEHYASLEEQLKTFGAGIEVTLLSAIPAEFRTGHKLHPGFDGTGSSQRLLRTELGQARSMQPHADSGTAADYRRRMAGSVRRCAAGCKTASDTVGMGTESVCTLVAEHLFTDPNTASVTCFIIPALPVRPKAFWQKSYAACS